MTKILSATHRLPVEMGADLLRDDAICKDGAKAFGVGRAFIG